MKLCECGCGVPTPISKFTRRKLGYAKGEPVRFLHGHNRRKHGHSRRTRTYRSWVAMKTRCLNPRFQQFADYGGRGIQICAPWLVFEKFLTDMGERPEGKSLDRIDHEGNYEPGNCRWATRSEQARNRRARRPAAATQSDLSVKTGD